MILICLARTSFKVSIMWGAKLVKKYSQSEVIDLLDAMKKKAQHILSLVKVVEKEASSTNFAMYDDFTKKISDFETLSILVDTRLKNLSLASNGSGNLQKQFNSLMVDVVHGEIKAGMKFLFVCTSTSRLPLGSENLFSNELRRLYRAQQEMSLPKYETLLDEETLHDMSIAQLILQEIIEKAPRLLNFDAA